jgi:hypothetical protein
MNRAERRAKGRGKRQRTLLVTDADPEKVATPAVQGLLERLAALGLEPGEFRVIQMAHDDWCPVLRKPIHLRSLADCTCNPDLRKMDREEGIAAIDEQLRSARAN